MIAATLPQKGFLTGFVVFLLFLTACQARLEITDDKLVGTELFSPSPEDDSPSLQPILGLFMEQLTDSSVVHLAVPQLSPQLVSILLAGLRAHPGAILHLLTDPISWNEDRGPKMQSVRDSLRSFAELTGQIAVENEPNPRAGWLGWDLLSFPQRMSNSFLLANQLMKPTGLSKDVVVVFSAQGLADQCSPAAYALSMDGAPELFAPFLKYWTSLSESQLNYEFQIAPESGSRKIAFLPSPQGDAPLKGLISLFAEAMEKSGKPLKIRAAVPVWDSVHLEIAQQLRALRELYEADIRLLLPPQSQLSDTVWRALGPEASEWTKDWEALDQDGYWLIDGPFEKEPGIYHRQSLLLLGQYNLGRHSDTLVSSVLFSIHEPTLFKQLESQWELAWEEMAIIRPATDSLALPNPSENN